MDDLPFEPIPIETKLRKWIQRCDGIVCLVGFAFGAGPHRHNEPPSRSYTQMEYDIAMDLGLPVYLFIAREGLKHPPISEAPELLELQERFRQQLLERRVLERRSFQSEAELRDGLEHMELTPAIKRLRKRPKTSKEPASPREGTCLVCVDGSGPIGAAFCIAQRQYVATTADVARRVESGIAAGLPVRVFSARSEHALRAEQAGFDENSGLGWLRLSTNADRPADLEIDREISHPDQTHRAVLPVWNSETPSPLLFDYQNVRLAVAGGSIRVSTEGELSLLLPGTPICDSNGRVVALITEIGSGSCQAVSMGRFGEVFSFLI